MSYIEKEKLIKADIDSIENRVRHAFNQGYDLGYKEGKANCSKNSTDSTTKNDLAVDCISRLDAIYAVSKLLKNIFVEHEDIANKVIGKIPSVTPQEPKTGHWEEHDTGHSTYYDCSLCGCVAPCTETADSFLWKLSNFCPDCGAKMVEPQESEVEDGSN